MNQTFKSAELVVFGMIGAPIYVYINNNNLYIIGISNYVYSMNNNINLSLLNINNNLYNYLSLSGSLYIVL